MEEYEQANNFKYDIVIRTKTDYIYSNSGDKTENYIIPQDKLNTNFALVTNLKIRKFLHDQNGFKNFPLKEYTPGVTLNGESIYENIRYDINTLSATRSAAYFLFNTWFETYLKALIFDKMNKLDKTLQSNKKSDVLWGYTAIYNNISLIGKKKKVYSFIFKR